MCSRVTSKSSSRAARVMVERFERHWPRKIKQKNNNKNNATTCNNRKLLKQNSKLSDCIYVARSFSRWEHFQLFCCNPNLLQALLQGLVMFQSELPQRFGLSWATFDISCESVTDWSIVVPSLDQSYDPWLRWRHLPGSRSMEGGSHHSCWDADRRKSEADMKLWGHNYSQTSIWLRKSYVCIFLFFLYLWIKHFVNLLLPSFFSFLSCPSLFSLPFLDLCPQWASLCWGGARGSWWTVLGALGWGHRV